MMKRIVFILVMVASLAPGLAMCEQMSSYNKGAPIRCEFALSVKNLNDAQDSNSEQQKKLVQSSTVESIPSTQHY